MTAPAVGTVTVITLPCTGGKTARARYQGNGEYLVYGNTNGWPVNVWNWLAWGIKNKKIRAARSWAASPQVQDWGQSFVVGGLFNRIAPIAIEAIVAAGIAEGVAAVGPSLGGGGGVGSGGSSALSQSIADASKTIVTAQPIQLSSLSIPSSGFAQLSASDLTLAGTAAGGAAGAGSGGGVSSFTETLFGKGATLDQIAQTAGAALALASAPGGGGASPDLGAPVNQAPAKKSPWVWVLVLLGLGLVEVWGA